MGKVSDEIVKLGGGDAPEHTISFPAVTAKYFRVTFKRPPPPPIPDWAAGIDPASMGIKVPPPPTTTRLQNWCFIPERASTILKKRRHLFRSRIFMALQRLQSTADQAVAKSDVIDLTSQNEPGWHA